MVQTYQLSLQKALSSPQNSKTTGFTRFPEICPPFDHAYNRLNPQLGKQLCSEREASSFLADK